MTTDYLIKGIIIGFSIAAPVGPIGVLTIKRTLTAGRISGFVTGMGAAMADTVYGIIAAFGLTAISSFLLTQEFWIKLIGGNQHHTLQMLTVHGFSIIVCQLFS
jgi:threonine/homoserine/homoserine lactone efflux protein